MTPSHPPGANIESKVLNSLLGLKKCSAVSVQVIKLYLLEKTSLLG